MTSEPALLRAVLADPDADEPRRAYAAFLAESPRPADQARGCRLHVDGQDLLVGPGERLTDADRDQIRRWKPHLLAIVSYDAETQERPQ